MSTTGPLRPSRVYSPPPWRATRHGALHGGAAPDDPRPRRPDGAWGSSTVQAISTSARSSRSSSSPASLLRVLIAAVYLPLSGFVDRRRRLHRVGSAPRERRARRVLRGRLLRRLPARATSTSCGCSARSGARLAPIVGQDITGGLVKIPGILADVGVAWLLFVIARRWGARAARRSCASISSAEPRAGGRDALPVQPGRDLRLGGVGPDRLGRHAASCSRRSTRSAAAGPRRRRSAPWSRCSSSSSSPSSSRSSPIVGHQAPPLRSLDRPAHAGAPRSSCAS